MFGRGAVRVAEAGARLVAGADQARRWPAASSGTGRAASKACTSFRRSRSGSRDWLTEQKIDGVVFLSGDRHFGELLKIERAGAYPLYEYTSSPLTSQPVTKPDAAERDNPDVVAGTLQGKRQFGLIRVSGPGNDRRIAFEAYDSDGNPLWRHEIRANDLRFPRGRP